MNAAAQALVGHHDFTTFRDVDCQAKSPVKTLDVAEVRREGEEVRLTFAARSFLHRQVRSMTGTLAEVGAGRWTAGRPESRAGGRRPHRLRPGRAGRGALSGRGGVLSGGAHPHCGKALRRRPQQPCGLRRRSGTAPRT